MVIIMKKFKSKKIKKRNKRLRLVIFVFFFIFSYIFIIRYLRGNMLKKDILNDDINYIRVLGSTYSRFRASATPG